LSASTASFPRFADLKFPSRKSFHDYASTICRLDAACNEETSALKELILGRINRQHTRILVARLHDCQEIMTFVEYNRPTDKI
jgi:hypothetical protein